MKTLLTIFLLALVGHAQQDVRIAGQRNLAPSLITWTTGANTGKTRLLFLANNVYLDTSSTGQAGAFKRIDNTADSCSMGFNLGSDSLGTSRPVWLNKILGSFRSVDQDSGSHVYRVQTRERLWNNTTMQWYYKGWSRFNTNSGYADVTVQDSVLIRNSASTAKNVQYAYCSVDGAQARLCPDDIAATGNAAGDSVFADSLIYFGR